MELSKRRECCVGTGIYHMKPCPRRACIEIDGDAYCWQHAKQWLGKVKALTPLGREHLRILFGFDRPPGSSR